MTINWFYGRIFFGDGRGLTSPCKQTTASRDQPGWTWSVRVRWRFNIHELSGIYKSRRKDQGPNSYCSAMASRVYGCSMVANGWWTSCSLVVRPSSMFVGGIRHRRCIEMQQRRWKMDGWPDILYVGHGSKWWLFSKWWRLSQEFFFPKGCAFLLTWRRNMNSAGKLNKW